MEVRAVFVRRSHRSGQLSDEDCIAVATSAEPEQNEVERKLIDLLTGKVVRVWTELQSGLQDSSIVWSLEGEAKPPPMALDPAGKRFAIVNRDTVMVITFETPD